MHVCIAGYWLCYYYVIAIILTFAPFILKLIVVIYSIAQSLGHFRGSRVNCLAVSVAFVLESVRTNQWYC
jgi:hypothetical protein